MLYSTSSYYEPFFGDTAHYLKKQLFATALGVVAMIMVSKIPYRFWMKLSGFAYLLALGLCTAVIFVGREAKGQARWLNEQAVVSALGICKAAVILFLAMITDL